MLFQIPKSFAKNSIIEKYQTAVNNDKGKVARIKLVERLAGKFGFLVEVVIAKSRQVTMMRKPRQENLNTRPENFFIAEIVSLTVASSPMEKQ